VYVCKLLLSAEILEPEADSADISVSILWSRESPVLVFVAAVNALETGLILLGKVIPAVLSAEEMFEMAVLIELGVNLLVCAELML
jgi:hypothetical protein